MGDILHVVYTFWPLQKCMCRGMRAGKALAALNGSAAAKLSPTGATLLSHRFEELSLELCFSLPLPSTTILSRPALPNSLYQPRETFPGNSLWRLPEVKGYLPLKQEEPHPQTSIQLGTRGDQLLFQQTMPLPQALFQFVCCCENRVAR